MNRHQMRQFRSGFRKGKTAAYIRDVVRLGTFADWLSHASYMEISGFGKGYKHGHLEQPWTAEEIESINRRSESLKERLKPFIE